MRKYYDPYIKAFRWASDRIGPEGIIAFVTNHSFVNDNSFDGIRKCLEAEFDLIYILDLGGNVRKNPKFGKNNVFGIRPGVSINFFIIKGLPSKKGEIFYFSTNEEWSKEIKFKFLEEKKSVLGDISWGKISPDNKYTWITEGIDEDYDYFLPIGLKKKNKISKKQTESAFSFFSLGVSTNRDSIVYNFQNDNLSKEVNNFIKEYNMEVLRYQNYVENCKKESKEIIDIDHFVNYDKIQWSSTLKHYLENGILTNFNSINIRQSSYRPFTKKYLYYDSILNDRPAHFNYIFPKSNNKLQNSVICVTVVHEKPFTCIIANDIVDLHFCGGFGTQTQCFPFYRYSENGTTRQENLTDWAQEQFQERYVDSDITKWNIFYYIYALLHHPDYREKYAANLKRELPRIPFAPDFWSFAQAGARLAEIHLNYESQSEYPLQKLETPGLPLNWRVEKMKLSKDKTAIIYNKFLTLTGVPPPVFDYKLGNRSALEWIIDQYRVSTDKQNNPNRADDPQYIVRLLGQIITVSLETLSLVNGLPPLE